MLFNQMLPGLPQPFWLSGLFLLGLIVGSFLNVMALRLLKEESLVFPASHCMACNTPIAWYDNIPVLSYILLGGKCRACHAPISIQYPLVELTTAWLFALVGLQFGVNWLTPALLFLVANLVVITITDLKESLVFQLNSLTLVPAGLILNLAMPAFLATPLWLNIPEVIPVHIAGFSFNLGFGLLSCLLGILVPILFFEGLILLSRWLLKTEGFGHGDTHIMMGVGAYLGVERCVVALLLGFIIQTAWAVPTLMWQWIKNKQYVSLGSGVGAFVFAILPMGLIGMQLPAGIQQGLTILCALLTLVMLFVFLRQVRHSESYTYLPLGPALVAGSLISLFCWH